jgi:nucleoside-diphosphate-sugar epimerase
MSSSSIRRVLVTGSSGTIGTALSERLLRDGYEFTSVDKRMNPWSAAVRAHTAILDLTDAAALKKLGLRNWTW